MSNRDNECRYRRPIGTPDPGGKFGCPTKVKRVPHYWDVGEISSGLEEVHSYITECREQIDEATKRAGPAGLNSRWVLLVRYIEQIERAFPKTFHEPESD